MGTRDVPPQGPLKLLLDRRIDSTTQIDVCTSEDSTSIRLCIRTDSPLGGPSYISSAYLKPRDVEALIVALSR